MEGGELKGGGENVQYEFCLILELMMPHRGGLV